jgi:hypothetical protein
MTSVSVTTHRSSKRPANGRQALQFAVQKSEVKGCVVDDKLGALHKFEEFRRDYTKIRLVGKEVIGDPMHFYGALIDFTVGIDVLVKMIAGEFAVN